MHILFLSSRIASQLSNMEQSTYPQAICVAEGAYAHAITHVEGVETANSLLLVKASQTINLPSYKIHFVSYKIFKKLWC